MRRQLYQRFFPKCIPTRCLICLMMFTACWTSYMCRMQMPILAVPMIVQAGGAGGDKGACSEESEPKPAGTRRKRASWFDINDMLYEHWTDSEPEYTHPILPRSANSSDDLINLRESTRNWTKAQLQYGPDQLVSRRKRQENAESAPKDDGISLFSGKPFDWSPEVRGQLIASYSYGNVPGNLIGGVLAMKWGPRQAILWSSVLACIISFVTPLIAQLHWGALCFSRVVIGLTGGITFPACHTMVAKWAPPDEKSRFVWSLLGGTFGTIFTYPMIAGLADNINWETGWYLPSLLMIIWIIFWVLIAYDSPDEHPGISDEERDYIKESQAGTVGKKKPTLTQTPICKIMTSIPFISLIICHFGNLFLLFFYQNSMMLYLSKALGFKLTKGGAMASLPWAGRMLFGFFFSWAGDTIKKKKLLSITWLRKLATIFSHLLPGVFLIGVGYVGCQLVLANVFLVLALGFNGAASIANLSNNQDLSPNFAGFLYGIMNTIGCTAGIIIPPIVEAIAGKHGNAIDKWQIVFWIGAGVTIISMMIFFIGGSGEIQSWNEVPEDDKPAEDAEAAPPPAEAPKA